MPPNKNLGKLQKLLELMDGESLTRADILKAIQLIVDHIKQFKGETATNFTTAREELLKIADSAKGNYSATLQDLRKQVNALFVGERMTAMEKTHAEMMARHEEKMTGVKNGRDGLPGKPGPKGDRGSADTPQDVRNKLETLKGKERLSMGAVDGLIEKLDALLKRIDNKVTYVGTGSHGTVKAYDLSSQLDGVTTTFNLPAMLRVIDVRLSSAPHALRETVDFTWTPTSITFTSEINAAASLAAGQTCIILYSEA